MLNQCAFIGNLGRDPEIKTFNDGGKIANFSVAVSEKWKDKTSGEQKERTEWVNVSVKNDGLVGVVERFLKKGSKVYVQGKMQTRKWQDQSGADRYSTEIVLQGFNSVLVMLDGAKDGGNTDRREPVRSTQDWGGNGSAQRTADPFAGGSGMDGGLDDDVPFITCNPIAEDRGHVA